MSISSSMNAGVMGLEANSNKLAMISDNIANSQTYGYKRVQADFSAMVNGSGKGSYSAGGVRSVTSYDIGQNGSLSGTNNATDLSVRGKGFMPVTSEAAVNGGGQLPLSLATTGSFRTDQNGYLRTETGQVLMGVKADRNGNIPAFPRQTADGLEPVQINSNQLVSDPTTEVGLGVNIPATAADGDAERLSVQYYDGFGEAQTLAFDFAKTGNANEWTMSVTDQASGNANDYTLQFSNATGEEGNLAAVTAAGGPAAGAPYSYDPATGEISFPVGANNRPISVNVGATADGPSATNLTQLSNVFQPNVDKNGAAAGNIVGVEVDGNGMLTASYDNGTSRTLYQIPVAAVGNPNALNVQDDQTYQPTRESGSFYLWDAGTGPTGEVAGYSLEESTTDVAQELTDLIQTQRAYSSNAKIIQTADEMLQETTNIKR